MFALLEHHQPAHPSAPTLTGAPPDQSALHWDLLIEIPGQEPLATWRLSQNPAETTAPIPATRLKDHGRIYLDYEGPLTGDRGWVTRLDRGEALLRRTGGAAERGAEGVKFVLELHGHLLNGVFEIASSGPNLCLRRAP